MSSNLDEFFEVRAAPYVAAARSAVTHGACTAASLEALAAQAHALVSRQYALYNDELVPAFAAHGIRVVSQGARRAAQLSWVKVYFQYEVRHLLVPLGLDPAHPFPQVAKKSLNRSARRRICGAQGLRVVAAPTPVSGAPGNRGDGRAVGPLSINFCAAWRCSAGASRG